MVSRSNSAHLLIDPDRCTGDTKCVVRPSGAVLFLALATSLNAQRVFEADGNVIYEDSAKRRINLGAGFNPLLTADGKVALIRGRQYGYGERFDCSHKETKNWIALYDPKTTREKVIFDRTLEYDGDPRWAFCIFDQMQLSHNGSMLYLVSPVYATAGSLAIVDLPRGSVAYVPGVILIYVIENAAHPDELIYQRRRISHNVKLDAHTYYPFVHARPNGKQIKELSDESLTAEFDKVPHLRAYLRKIGGTITVNGRRLP